jgi:hypothetical protein
MLEHENQNPFGKAQDEPRPPGVPAEPHGRRRKKRRKNEKLAGRRRADVPYWVPDGTLWEQLPAGIRRAVSQVLAPAYRRFVLEAPGPLERSVGITMVHLMWLEVYDQLALAETLKRTLPPPAPIALAAPVEKEPSDEEIM